jgi:hypothetical protein
VQGRRRVWARARRGSGFGPHRVCLVASALGWFGFGKRRLCWASCLGGQGRREMRVGFGPGTRAHDIRVHGFLPGILGHTFVRDSHSTEHVYEIYSFFPLQIMRFRSNHLEVVSFL